ncbi:hypothetical protein GH714_029995 [Hevea brasiliensis]|uniref:Myb-like domain-containing protein n=1 Tax=Hevea brasiliensis TaxID=3981 RepID=A0A6A6L0X1_HEVBR|nr:hypothetical protein GH714_029995 [Hevea brasiliensis]
MCMGSYVRGNVTSCAGKQRERTQTKAFAGLGGGECKGSGGECNGSKVSHSYSWQLARPSQAVSCPSCPIELTNVNLYRLMGFKRPFDSEEFQELPCKQARQVDYSNKLTQFANLYKTTSQGLDGTDDYEGSIVKSQQHDTFENNGVTADPSFAKDVEVSAPLPLVTSSSGDEDGYRVAAEDVGYRVAAYSSHSPEHSEFGFPQRFVPFENAYSSYLDRSPRRQVPLGPDHQASIPMWGGHEKKYPLEQVDSVDPNNFSSLSGSDLIYDDNEEKLMGACIIPMPDIESSADNSNEAGRGRTDCSCLDEGSIRCVRQHIMEAQQKLRKSLGHEKLMNLGLYDIGEEVTHKWSEDEQRLFHAVVFSNPASLGQNFWNYLSQVFPYRSTKEIVSYYFNVFMLRRRAAQNRSNLLEIDSDDDELHEINRGPFEVRVSDEDDGGDATGEDSGVDYVSEAHDLNSFDGSRLDAVVKHVDNNAGSSGEDFTVQDDSCMSFEFQADKFESCDPVDTGVALQLSGVKGDDRECLPSNRDEYSVVADQLYLTDHCDAKPWDAHYTVPMKGVDLLPTCNIIEEIFGDGTSNE